MCRALLRGARRHLVAPAFAHAADCRRRRCHLDGRSALEARSRRGRCAERKRSDARLLQQRRDERGRRRFH